MNDKLTMRLTLCTAKAVVLAEHNGYVPSDYGKIEASFTVIKTGRVAFFNIEIRKDGITRRVSLPAMKTPAHPLPSFDQMAWFSSLDLVEGMHVNTFCNFRVGHLQR